MNFDEHAAKSLVLAPAGIPVPRGQICRTAKEAAQAVGAVGPAVIKAQVAEISAAIEGSTYVGAIIAGFAAGCLLAQPRPTSKQYLALLKRRPKW